MCAPCLTRDARSSARADGRRSGVVGGRPLHCGRSQTDIDKYQHSPPSNGFSGPVAVFRMACRDLDPFSRHEGFSTPLFDAMDIGQPPQTSSSAWSSTMICKRPEVLVMMPSKSVNTFRTAATSSLSHSGSKFASDAFPARRLGK